MRTMPHRRVSRALCVMALGLLSAVQAAKTAPFQCPTRLDAETRLAPADGNIGALFGEWLDIDGDYAVIAAPGDDDNAVPNSGAVYVYQRSGKSWSQDAKIVLDPAELGDFFGDAVAISGDTLVIGAPYADGAVLQAEGAVRVYRRSAGQWDLEAELSRIDPGPVIGAFGDRFGHAVDIHQDRIIVGSIEDDDLGRNSGAAYIFERSGSTWTQSAKLIAGDGAGLDDRFYGNDVAIDGDRVAVGIFVDSTLGVGAGAAYVYDFDGSSWVETKLLASDGNAYDYFGRQVDIDGNRLVVGASGDDDSPGGALGQDKGAAYLFERDSGGWNQTAKLTDASGGTQDGFGFRVAIDGKRLLTSSPSPIGAAFLYERRANGTWRRVDKLLNSDAEPIDPGTFGSSVNLSGDRLLVGAFSEDGSAVNSGAAFVYTLTNDCPLVTP